MIPALVDDFAGFQDLSGETADVMKIARNPELEVEPEDVTKCCNPI